MTSARFSALAVLLVTFIAGAAVAAGGTVEGRVVDANGLGLPGVTVSVTGPVSQAVLSELEGRFRLGGLPTGTYEVLARIPGFLPVEQTIEVVADQPVVLEFQLQPAFEEMVVVSATRANIALEDAPTTVSVIDQETIETAPARNVGDLLRSVPGVNVVQASARDINVASRQASPFLAGSQLAMIDGRPLYFDFFNVIFWDLVSVSASDVQQIEVVRGPASAMWGANAASGVVNMVTKSPRDSQGLTVDLHGGLLQRNEASGGTGSMGGINVRWADAVSDRLAYRISVGYYTSDPFERPTGTIPVIETPIGPPVTVGGGSFEDAVYSDTGTQQPKVDIRVDQELDGEGRLVYAAGAAGTQGIIHTQIGPFEALKGTFVGYGQMTYTRGGLRASAFANHITGEGPSLITVDENEDPLLIDFTNNVYDGEVGYRDLFGSRHLMTFGGNIRFNTFDLSIAPDAGSRRQIGAYVQDEIDLGRFQLALALRGDHHDNLDSINVSPRAALIWTPVTGHKLKLSFSRAFRAPSALENSMDVSIVGTYIPLDQFDPRLEEPFPLIVRDIGNPDLEAEIIDAWEVGYSAVLNDGRTRLDINVYQTQTENSISLTPSAEAMELAGIEPFYTSDNPPPGWPLHPIVIDLLDQLGIQLPSTFMVLNIGSVRNQGLELSARHVFRTGWTLFGNYSYQREPKLLDPVGDPDRPPSETVNVPPEHRFNLGFAFSGRHWLGNLTVNYSDKAYFGQGFNPAYYGYSDAYTLVGATVGRRWMDGQVVTSLKAINLLDDAAQQHVFGDVLRRTIILELGLRF